MKQKYYGFFLFNDGMHVNSKVCVIIYEYVEGGSDNLDFKKIKFEKLQKCIYQHLKNSILGS